MCIDIVFRDEEGVKTTRGTKVFTQSGTEIEGVSRIEIIADVDCVLMARIDVPINKVNSTKMIAALGYDSLRDLADACGYKITPKTFGD